MTEPVAGLERTSARSIRQPRIPERPANLPAGVYRALSAHSGVVYYYGDFRKYADIGGRREPLRAPGSRFATTDPNEAARLYADRVRHYERARRDRAPLPGDSDPRLGPMMALHLRQKAAAGAHRPSTLRADCSNLTRILVRLGNVRLSAVVPARLQQYVRKRLCEPGVRAETTISPRTVRNELLSLSNMFVRAIALGYATFNPVDLMPDKPRIVDVEAEYLRTVEAATLLDAAAALDVETAEARRALAMRRTLGAAVSDETEAMATLARVGSWRRVASVARRCAFIEAIVATLLYTGARLDEVLGLTVGDVDFVRRLVHLRPNKYRRLKRDRHKRSIPLLRPLEFTLRHHMGLMGIDRLTPDALLFPGRTGRKMHGFSTPFARCLELAGLVGKQRVTRHTLRHTYASKALRTVVYTERGERAARSSLSVAKLLGHKSAALVDAVYGHDLHGEGYSDELTFEPWRRMPASRLVARSSEGPASA